MKKQYDKVTNSVINKVVYKRRNSVTNDYDVVNVVEDMLFVTFIAGLDSLYLLGEVHWSVDYLNLDYTQATVYVEF